jgi:hypothetical protein
MRLGMNSNLEEKRRELFELHKAKLGTDAPLMRRQVNTTIVEKRIEEPKVLLPTKTKIKYAIIGVTSIVVLIELLFLAREAGWLG